MLSGTNPRYGRATGDVSLYRRAVPGESFFMAFGGLGVSLAGFAGLIAALRRDRPEDLAVAAYRIRTIVFLGFSLTFAGFGAVAVFSATGDAAVTARIATLLLAVAYLRGLLFDTRPGPVWPVERNRRMTIVILLVLLGLTLNNFLLASLPYLQLLLILALVGPVSIFYATIVDATGGPHATTGGQPADAEP